ncbi:cytochrome C [Methylacidiphilum kamchatkense Kam1]|uniref:Cytochrome C n=1 Tax=Methylacidiphilum kamchatkense Kam1 TaxID=1202785 RepID=A0A0C1UR59_9BACT|nr:c-type cytochrome [Methylacidiphilum kamchatkense]KIE58348.1 cytochrome C [Methylacidiphilum kamchatkense Kam1]QDQ42248.1 mono/diheme cytochrome c family protein [Methylacidiphilum kamchatkense Kam1]
MKKISIVYLMLSLLPLSSLFAQAKNPYTPSDKTVVSQGKELYFKMGCNGCHGAGGGGGMCPSFIDDTWVFGSDDQTLFKLIKGQIPQQTMPRMFGGVLTDDEIWKVITFVRYCKVAASEQAAGASGQINIDKKSCAIVEADPHWLRAVLPKLTGYQNQYVLVFDGSSKNFSSAEDSKLAGATLAILDNSSGKEIASLLHAKPKVYPDKERELGKPVEDLLAGKVDGAILWAPLAAFYTMELDSSRKLKMIAFSKAYPAPKGFEGQEQSSMVYVTKCAEALLNVLKVYNVAPK